MVDKGDWRLTDQIEYLFGVDLVKMKWASDNPSWDHDHCVFCWAKLPDEAPEGYCTKDNGDQWICPQCYSDFKDMFQWK